MRAIAASSAARADTALRSRRRFSAARSSGDFGGAPSRATDEARVRIATRPRRFRPMRVDAATQNEARDEGRRDGWRNETGRFGVRRNEARRPGVQSTGAPPNGTGRAPPRAGDGFVLSLQETLTLGVRARRLGEIADARRGRRAGGLGWGSGRGCSRRATVVVVVVVAELAEVGGEGLGDARLRAGEREVGGVGEFLGRGRHRGVARDVAVRVLGLVVLERGAARVVVVDAPGRSSVSRRSRTAASWGTSRGRPSTPNAASMRTSSYSSFPLRVAWRKREGEGVNERPRAALSDPRSRRDDDNSREGGDRGAARRAPRAWTFRGAPRDGRKSPNGDHRSRPSWRGPRLPRARDCHATRVATVFEIRSRRGKRLTRATSAISVGGNPTVSSAAPCGRLTVQPARNPSVATPGVSKDRERLAGMARGMQKAISKERAAAKKANGPQQGRVSSARRGPRV